MQVLVGMRLRAHACALLELQIIQYQSTQWLMWWQVNKWSRWHKNTQSLQWIGVKLNSAHRRELGRIFKEFHRAVACRYHLMIMIV